MNECVMPGRTAGADDQPSTVRLRGNSLRLPALLGNRCFGDADTIAVLLDGDLLRLLPVHDAGAGGRLLKRCSAEGDRAVHVGDLLHDNGYQGQADVVLPAHWDDGTCALLVSLARLPGADFPQ